MTSPVSPDPKPIDIFAEVRKLNFPSEHFIVAGSAIMAVKGIRPAYDLDIIVTPELFEICKANGWELKPWTRAGKIGKPWLQNGNTDLMLELGFEDETQTATDLMEKGVVIDGIRFLSLEQLVKFKRDYGRPKDFDDIKLIEAFLSQEKNQPQKNQMTELDKNFKRKYLMSDYDSNWPIKFESIKKDIQEAFGDKALSIDHVGSTSIPGMRAKPVIDALVMVENIHELAEETRRMIDLGYEWGSNYIAPDTLIFFKTLPDGSKLENIHICHRDEPKTRQFLIMRDFFRAFPEKAKAYSDLKFANAAKHPDDYPAYRAAKKPFLDDVEKEAYAWDESGRV